MQCHTLGTGCYIEVVGKNFENKKSMKYRARVLGWGWGDCWVGWLVFMSTKQKNFNPQEMWATSTKVTHSSPQRNRADQIPLCWGQSKNGYLLVTWLWNKNGFFSFSGFYSHTVFQTWLSTSAAQRRTGISFPIMWVDCFWLGKLIGICQLVKWYKLAG